MNELRFKSYPCLFACVPGIVIWLKRTTPPFIFASWVSFILDVANFTPMIILQTISPMSSSWIDGIFASTNWALLSVAAFDSVISTRTISAVLLLNKFSSSVFSDPSSTCPITRSFSPWTPFTRFRTKLRTTSMASLFHIASVLWTVAAAIMGHN